MRFILPLITLLSGTADVSANIAPVNFIGKSKDEIWRDISMLEYQILTALAPDQASFRSSVRSYAMGCLMAMSSKPHIKGTVTTPDTRYGDVATIFLSDVAHCAASLRTIGEQLKLTDKLGEAVVVKEHALLLNDLDFFSSPDTRISNTIQGCIDLGSLCFDVGDFTCSQKSFAKAAHIMTSNNVENDELSSLIAKVGASQFRAGNYSDAFESYNTALQFLRKLGSTNKELIGSITSSLAATMFRQKNYLDAERTYKTALNHLKSMSQKNWKLIAAATKNLGSTLYARGMWLDAVGHYEEALSLYVSFRDTDGEFSDIVETVIIALNNAADDAASSRDPREEYSLRERAAKVTSTWAAKREVSDKSAKLSNNKIQEGADREDTNIIGTPLKERGHRVSLFAWLLRLVFAAAIAAGGYTAITFIDWAKPVPPQIKSIANKLMQFAESYVGVGTMKSPVSGSWWTSSIPERRPAKSEAAGSSRLGLKAEKSHAVSAVSLDKKFGQPEPKIVSVPRKSSPSYIPSE